MVKVITYGTYDLLHRGHLRLLERAKALGDYLIVAVTTDDFDKSRGKINIQQSLMERVEAVKATGIADEVIVEEYEGQKIDDIIKYDVDIFTVGSDWVGVFDYLNAYCKVVYLPRTEGVSSSEIRTNNRKIKIGLVGEPGKLSAFQKECSYVNGIEVVGACTTDAESLAGVGDLSVKTHDYSELVANVDALYIASHPAKRYEQIKYALMQGKHVIGESPIALSEHECSELFLLAKSQNCVLTDGVKTAYSNAYSRLVRLLQSQKIGKIISVDATCTSLADVKTPQAEERWDGACTWLPTALLPVFQLLGTEYQKADIVTAFADEAKTLDVFDRIDFVYKNAVASVKIGNGVKSDNTLVVSGTKGCLYVPEPWWNTEYFEVRFNDKSKTKKYFYQLDGEGIRHEIIAFADCVLNGAHNRYITEKESIQICRLIEQQKSADTLKITI